MAMRCEYWSIKLGRIVFLDSLHEFEFVPWLDYIPEITDFAEAANHDIKIPYKFDNKDHNYIPDFIIETNWMTLIVEIKPKSKIGSKKNQLKFKAARKYCQQQGSVFLVVTKDLLKIGYEHENIKLLVSYGKYDVRNNEIDSIIYTIKELGGACTLAELMDASQLKSKSRAKTVALHCAYLQLLHVNLSGQQIDNSSILKLRRGSK